MKPTYEELELQLEESQREFRAADVTIHNLELKLTDMAVQLANAESKCMELAVLVVILPKLPVLGSTAEWYQGFAAGSSGMRNECADAIRAAGIRVAPHNKGDCDE